MAKNDLIVILVVAISIMGIVLNAMSRENDRLRDENNTLRKRLGEVRR